MIDSAPVQPPTELVCFIKLPDGRIQDLSAWCGEPANPPQRLKGDASAIDQPPVYSPPNSGNRRPADADPAQAESAEPDE